MTGRFEKLSKSSGGSSLDIMHKKANAMNQAGSILSGGANEIKMYFGSAGEDRELTAVGASKTAPKVTKDTPGYRHKVTVALGDTIHQFKKKLQKACQEEAKLMQKEAESKQNP